MRFHRRGESQADNVDRLLIVVLDGRCEQSFYGFILSSDRGYCKMDPLGKILKYDVGSIFVMPKYRICCRPFVAKWNFHFGSNNDYGRNIGVKETGQAGVSTMEHFISKAVDRLPSASTEQVKIPTTGTESIYDENAALLTTQMFPVDRPVQFIIEDDANAFRFSHFSSKKVTFQEPRGQ